MAEGVEGGSPLGPSISELGEQLGRGWAQTMHDNRVAMREGGKLVDPVAIVAAGRIPEPVRRVILEAGAREQLAASGDPDAESKLWAAFVAGVETYLALPSLGMGQN